ncbi:hypothetical protein K435DRAFT_108856 [Dendrothele bispora CBS 962.96]|uniref:Uncharacterized protein n=1 Tax=Dendrothele bispora (strain CBS 962.96) TaxID=1314807 RepID=A0A4S8M1U9_DENBC|nr:hypothetical protein K435DRAFT_108856 [Dendrothele bispora CBS 962.96]
MYILLRKRVLVRIVQVKWNRRKCKIILMMYMWIQAVFSCSFFLFPVLLNPYFGLIISSTIAFTVVLPLYQV